MGRDVVVWIGRGVVVALDDALGADPPPPQLARTITHTSPLQTVRILMDAPPLPSRSRARILPDRAHSGERIAAVRARVVIVGWGGIEPPRRVARPGYNRVGSPPAQPPRRVSTRRSAPTVSERWDIGERLPLAYGTDSRLPRSSIFETHGAPDQQFCSASARRRSASSSRKVRFRCVPWRWLARIRAFRRTLGRR